MSYLFDPGNYDMTDPNSIPNLFIQHMTIVGITMLISLIIAIPIGIMVARYRRLYTPLITLTGAMYSIPAMAFLGVLVIFTGLNMPTVIIPLVIYNQLALIRNTVAGIEGVDPLLLEAARAMGMSRWQRLIRVTLPLALPVIVAGIRLATVTTIGIVSLSQLVGVPSLGTLIFIGFQNLNNDQLFAGALLITIIALLADLLLLALQVVLNRGRSALSVA
ncbi:MAG TPA: ABC transporter permease [Ktedonobacteraceae bacterium]|jgi:osmoprotectant transport system permease protein|nr:ABC transporter permease [Ktedonobacteraceae bacterium]